MDYLGYSRIIHLPGHRPGCRYATAEDCPEWELVPAQSNLQEANEMMVKVLNKLMLMLIKLQDYETLENPNPFAVL